MVTSTILLLLIAVLTLLYLYIRKGYSYWKDRNVVYLEPDLLYGNLKEIIKNNVPITDLIDEIYNKVKTKGKQFGGIYSFLSPIFVPVDLDLIKQIMQNDFSYFVNHGVYLNEEKEPLTAHLFSLEDEKWRNLRAKLTPTFTTGKMRVMFQTLVACTVGLEEMLKKVADTKSGIDIKDIVGRYTTDIIGSVGFGIDVNSMENPDSEFKKYGSAFFDPTLTETRNLFVLSLLPRWFAGWFANRLNLRTMSEAMESFYMNLVKDTVAYREQNNVYRKDFLHLLIQLKNLGKVGEDDDRTLLGQNANNTPGITLQQMAAQSFLFLAAGFETSSSTVTFALLELSQRQDIQDKLREEINTTLKKYNNKITYEAIAEMEYLEKTILETLRKHPPVAALRRICNKRYQVPNTDFILEEGTKINIPVLSIQRDPNYYSNPENFDPERFSPEDRAKRYPMSFLAFGEGPRMCIGLRLGKLQAKVGLCSVLKKYRVTLHEKTQLPVKYEMIFVTAVKGGVWINLEPLS